ncbi:hypothetical protein I4F81_001347 [Pyropia yezoensis]|uniref:Uncharacterized protein n=1 Tax=Pyropia yezoensis TaxID=2788 RepID=A0ACC3BLX6_PYRYE|nr:hypothetical protein I4F81_001347 [Neopyropia yezoensis]
MVALANAPSAVAAAAAEAVAAVDRQAAADGVSAAVGLAAVVTQLQLLGAAVDVGFLTLAGVLVCPTMQTGFAMLTAGSVRAKNVKSVLMKVLMDTCVGGVAWMLFGNAFAYGEKANAFLGHSGWALADGDTTDLAVFSSDGLFAERASFYAYLGATLWLTSFVYPVVAHAVWDSAGWLSASTFASAPLLGIGAIDHAGCASVHMVGAVCGLWGAVATGPRRGRFADDGTPHGIPGHSAPLTLLGGLLLWTGWFGFNAGSGLSLTTYEASSGLFPGRVVALGDGSELLVSGLLTVQQTLTSTMLGACGGALVGMALSYVFAFHVIDLSAIVNCLLAGLVSITAGCATFYPYISLLVGMVGAAVYMGASRAMVWLRIDDPLDAVAIHGACGLWGLLAVGLFSARDAQAAAGFRATHYGAAFGGGWRLLACQAVGAVFVIGWTTITTVPLWYSLRALGLLRVTLEEEMDGLDEGLHGGTAYPIDESYTPWHSPTPPTLEWEAPFGGDTFYAISSASPKAADLDAVVCSIPSSPEADDSGSSQARPSVRSSTSPVMRSGRDSGSSIRVRSSGRARDSSRAIIEEMSTGGGTEGTGA